MRYILKWVTQIYVQQILADHPFTWTYIKHQDNRNGKGGDACWLEPAELVWKSQAPCGGVTALQHKIKCKASF